MECRKVQRHLSAFMDGVLDAQTSTFIKKHLSACRECQKELESLKTLVRDLGNLETVRAPDDFLEQLHKRMDAGSDFRRWIRILFVPFRVKVPLELATAVAMAVVIFAIVYRPQMENQIPHTPVGKIHKILEEKKTDTMTASAPIERKAEPAAPAVKSARSEEPAADLHPPQISSMKGEEMVEFELLLKRRTVEVKSSKDMKKTQEETMKEAEAKKIGSIAFKDKESVDYQKADKAFSQITTKNVSPGEKTDTWALSPYQAQKQIEELITNVKGTVVYTNYQKDTNVPQSITAEIPANQYASFYSKLQRIGSIQSPLPTVSAEGMDPIRIRIRFVAE